MRCWGSWLPLGDAARPRPRVLFHSQPGREQGWRWGPAGRASARLCHLFPQAGGGSSGAAQPRTGCRGWVFWASGLWSEPSGCPQNEERGDSSASPRALPPPQLKCLPARLKGSLGTGTECAQQPLERCLPLIPASLRAGLASASGQWLHLPGQVSACAGPSHRASSPLCKPEGWRVLRLSCPGCSACSAVDVPQPRQCHAIFQHLSRPGR